MKNQDTAKATRCAYYLKNRERILMLNKAYREKHRDRLLALKALRYNDPEKHEHHLAKAREYSQQNKEKKAKAYKKWYEKNKERRRNQQKAWAQLPAVAKRIKEKRRQRYKNNREKLRQQHRDWVEANRDHRRAYQKNLRKAPDYYSKFWQRRKSNPQARIASQLRSRINAVVKRSGTYKSARTENLIGCSFSGLINHLESLFTLGMAWNNYGGCGWEIDHKRPCASFDLTDPAQQRACFHYTNLQPLWRSENRSKWKRYEPELAQPI